MTAHLTRDFERVDMRQAEREQYVRWWVERSGLTEAQLRRIATGIWSDRELGAVTGAVTLRHKPSQPTQR